MYFKLLKKCLMDSGIRYFYLFSNKFNNYTLLISMIKAKKIMI